jgi:phosphate transport system substrate-binding protein
MRKAPILATVAAMILGAATISCNDDTTYYTVTFDGNGGRVYREAVITVAEGHKVPQPGNPTPPSADQVCVGWYREAEAINQWDFYNEVVTGDITLYAGWKQVRTVTYHANGGTFHNHSDGRETLTLDYLTDGEKLWLPDNVMKPGHVLEGWYRDEALTDGWDFGTDVVSGDVALYAKWEATIEGITRENYPRVDGATSTRALNMMIACKLLGVPYVWGSVSQTPESSVWPLDGNGYSDENFLGGRIKTSQTYGAMMNLIEGKTDIILRSTTASPDEKAAALAAGVTLTETPIALDAFVFLKNSANQVKSLTLDQIRKIYTKKITNWSEVGGDKAPMKVFARPRNSGSEEALRELVMDGQEPAEFPEEQYVPTMMGLFGEIGREKYAVGYIFKNYKEMIMRRYEPVFAIDGIYPDPTTMRNRTYPLTTEVYAIIRSDLDRNSMAYKLYEWLQTESAQTVLAECGFLAY